MISENEKNPILSGPIVPTAIKLAIPIVIGHLLQLLYNMVDTVFISFIDRTSTSLMSGIGLIFPLFMLCMALGVGMFTGTGSLVARAIGAKDKETLKRAGSSVLFLAGTIAVVLLVLSLLLGDKIIQLLAGDRLSIEAIKNGQSYFRNIIPGFVLMLFQMTLLGMQQGSGNVKHYAVSLLISTVTNIILDPIFIFVLDLGIGGAALATSASIGLALIYVIAVSTKGNVPPEFHINKVKPRLMQETLKIGMTQVLSMSALSIGVMLLNKIVGSISEDAMNSWTLVGRMDEILLITGYAVGNATLTMVGQCTGAKRFARARKIYFKNILAGAIVCFGAAVLYNLFAPLLFRAFSDLDSVIDGAVRQVRIVSWSMIGIVGSIISANGFQGRGKALPGFVLTIIRIGIIVVPIAWLLAIHFEMRMLGVFIAMGAGNTISLILALIWGNASFGRGAESSEIAAAQASSVGDASDS